MKKIIIVVLLVAVAGVAGIVRSRAKTVGGVRNLSQIINTEKSSDTAREEMRKSYQLSPGARVEVSGINGAVRIATSDSTTAEVLVQRFGASQEVLSRRKITVDATNDSLTIRAENDSGFFARLFGSQPHENVTLNLPRAVALAVKGVNGSVTSGPLDGSVDVRGINGRVEIAQTSGTASFKGINGNVAVSLKQIDNRGVTMSGINGNIELRLNEGVNADLEAHGMNGNVVSDLPGVAVDKSGHGRYSAQIGTGGTSISASGINGNIVLSRLAAS